MWSTMITGRRGQVLLTCTTDQLLHAVQVLQAYMHDQVLQAYSILASTCYMPDQL